MAVVQASRCSSNLTPSLRTSICHGSGRKKQKKTKKNQKNKKQKTKKTTGEKKFNGQILNTNIRKKTSLPVLATFIQQYSRSPTDFICARKREKKGIKIRKRGLPWWLRELRIQCCHCYGSAYSCATGSSLGPGFCACCRCGQ